MGRRRRYWKAGKWLILFGICLLFMSGTVKAQTMLSLDAEIDTAGNVLLKWQGDSPDYCYQLQRAKNGTGPFSVLTTVSNQTGGMAYEDCSVSLGKTYYYKVVKSVEGQIVEESDICPVKVTLAKPANLKSQITKDSKVKLTWNKVVKATGYEIYRSAYAGKKFRKIGSTKKNEFTDTTVQNGKTYYYKVSAIRKKQKSVTSKQSDVKAAYMKPGAPGVSGSYVKKKIKLTWNKVEGAEVYYIYKKNTKGKFEKIGETNKLYYMDKKVEKDKSYFYRVTAAYQKDGKTVKGKAGKTCKVLAAAINPNGKMVALTFDDGPGRYTKEIVNCLKNNNAKATFFVIGSQVDSYKSSVKAASDIGCEIGSHTYTHPDLTKLSESEIKEQISKTDQKVKNAIGKKTTLVRTPGGSVNSSVQRTVGKPIILWSIDTLDWKTRNREKTVNAVMSNVKDGDIVLMHDIYEPTKEAACILIVKLRQKGYQLVTVSELAKYRGCTLEKGKVYHSLRRK